MLNKKETHEVFGKVWKEFNKVRKNNTDDGWSECVKNVDELHNKYDNEFYEQIILIVIKEADRESKLDQNTARMEYKKAGKAFQEAWTMFEQFVDNIDSFETDGMKVLEEYNKQNPCRFAAEFGSVIYEAVCKETKASGSFMNAAYSFYEKYKAGIDEANAGKALAEAEQIINAHPEYMLHMMNMYSDLKNKIKAA